MDQFNVLFLSRSLRLAPGKADQCGQGINFDMPRPREQILLGYKQVLEKAYDLSVHSGRGTDQGGGNLDLQST
jgi:hypothetical protein